MVVPFPFADLSTQKVRPSVVVSGSEYHRDEPDVIVACVTSNVTGNMGSTDTLLADWKKAGLHVPSVVKAALSTLEPSMIRYRVGELTERDLSAVAATIARALELAPPVRNGGRETPATQETATEAIPNEEA